VGLSVDFLIFSMSSVTLLSLSWAYGNGIAWKTGES
jgi:hypothetical protein